MVDAFSTRTIGYCQDQNWADIASKSGQNDPRNVGVKSKSAAANEKGGIRNEKGGFDFFWDVTL